MPEKHTKVDCRLNDCLHYLADPAQPNTAWCKHPHKPQHLYDQPCALYRLDMMKKAQSNPDIMKQYQGKRRFF